jgi:hypothetical protein
MDTEDAKDSYPRLPDKFSAKVVSLPECSYGAVRVTLVLKDGRRIRDVIIGGDTICKIGQRHIRSAADLDFSVSDIENVKNGAMPYWPQLVVFAVVGGIGIGIISLAFKFLGLVAVGVFILCGTYVGILIARWLFGRKGL